MCQDVILDGMFKYCIHAASAEKVRSLVMHIFFVDVFLINKHPWVNLHIGLRRIFTGDDFIHEAHRVFENDDGNLHI